VSRKEGSCVGIQNVGGVAVEKRSAQRAIVAWTSFSLAGTTSFEETSRDLPLFREDELNGLHEPAHAPQGEQFLLPIEHD